MGRAWLPVTHLVAQYPAYKKINYYKNELKKKKKKRVRVKLKSCCVSLRSPTLGFANL